VARIFFTGFEIQGANTSGTGFPDGYQTGGSTFSTSIKRSGASSLALAASQSRTIQLAVGVSFPVYMRFYFRVENQLPATTTQFFNADNNQFLKLNSDGTVGLYNTAGTLTGNSSVALSVGTWYCIEVYARNDVNFVPTELRIDGVTQVTGNSLTTASTSGSGVFKFEGTGSAPGNFYFDDFSVDDATWCGDGSVVLLKPISDNSAGLWAIWSGSAWSGAGNYWNGVDNTPPTGVAANGEIGNNINTGTNEYRANLTTLSSLGITSNDFLFGIVGWVCHGEEVRTGTKSIAFGIFSNPSGATVTQTGLGIDDNTAAAAYPTGWGWKSTAVLANPIFSSGLNVSTVLSITKTDTGTRYAVITGAFAYLEYRPAVTAPFPPFPRFERALIQR
jgi:hypothetical protein